MASKKTQKNKSYFDTPAGKKHKDTAIGALIGGAVTLLFTAVGKGIDVLVEMWQKKNNKKELPTEVKEKIDLIKEQIKTGYITQKEGKKKIKEILNNL